jgi:hypothetical protein
VITVSYQPPRTSQVSAVSWWRLSHTLSTLPAADAARLLTTLPADLAARALAHTNPYHGMLIVRALGTRRVQRLIDVLPASSGSRRRLQGRLVDCRYTDRASDHGAKSAVEQIGEIMRRNPQTIRNWYRRT